jgi:Protein of unknown function (DUF4238)
MFSPERRPGSRLTAEPRDSRYPDSPGILKRVSGRNQHYLPAALIGGFGRPAASGRLRDAEVAVRRKATGAVDSVVPTAEDLASRSGMYRLASPPPGVDRDVVDKLWDPVENALRDLIARLNNRRLQPGDDQLLFAYAADASVRHPSFEALAAAHQARQGQAAPRGDAVQYTRVLARGNQLPVLPTWRWRVLHSPADAPRFMITDRGWMYVGQEDRPTDGLLFPMGPRVAILGYLDDPGLPPRRAAFEEHLDLCQSTIDYLNAAAWDDPYIELLIAHPDDQNRLASLPDHRNLRINALGPFRKHKSVGLFDLSRPVADTQSPPARWRLASTVSTGGAVTRRNVL